MLTFPMITSPLHNSACWCGCSPCVSARLFCMVWFKSIESLDVNANCHTEPPITMIWRFPGKLGVSNYTSVGAGVGVGVEPLTQVEVFTP